MRYRLRANRISSALFFNLNILMMRYLWHPGSNVDGVGITFGNGATGIVNGPAPANLDVALSKSFAVNWPREESFLQLRAGFYNTLQSFAILQPRQ